MRPNLKLVLGLGLVHWTMRPSLKLVLELELGQTMRPKRMMLGLGLERSEQTRLPKRMMLELGLERSGSMVAMFQQRAWWSPWW